MDWISVFFNFFGRNPPCRLVCFVKDGRGGALHVS